MQLAEEESLVKFLPTELPGVLIVEPDVYRDARGFFLETYAESRYREGGIDVAFVQDNHSRSRARHAARPARAGAAPAGRSSCARWSGEIFDVAVDIRRGSPTFGRWVGVHLSAENFRQL